MSTYHSAVILDDHQLFASAFASLIKATNKFSVVASTNKFAEVEQLLISGNVTHLFTDYIMPEVNTLSEIMNIRAKYPGLFIIVVSSITNANLIYQMHKAGANSFISKNSSKQELEECFSIMDTGKYFVSRDLRGAMMNLFSNGKETLFTAREHEILQHIAAGSTIEETAAQLNLSKHTIVAHRRNMMAKMEVNSVASLLKKAMDLGIL